MYIWILLIGFIIIVIAIVYIFWRYVTKNVYLLSLLVIILSVVFFLIYAYLIRNYIIFMNKTELFLHNDKNNWITFGKDLSGYYINNHKDNIVLYSHGNGGNLTWYLDQAHYLSKRSDVFLYDYPGYGLSKGTPTEKSFLKSAEDAYDYVKSLGYKKIYCYGFSMGGVATKHIATIRDPDGIVLQSTFDKISDCIPFVGKIIAGDCFANVKGVENIKCPVVVSHYINDEVVPYKSSKNFYNNIKSNKIFYNLNKSHNVLITDDNYYNDIINHFNA